jgi:hypothetical protein
MKRPAASNIEAAGLFTSRKSSASRWGDKTQSERPGGNRHLFNGQNGARAGSVARSGINQ